MPTHENTIKPRTDDVSFLSAVATAWFLGYDFLQYQDEVFAITGADTAILTSHAPLE